MKLTEKQLDRLNEAYLNNEIEDTEEDVLGILDAILEAVELDINDLKTHSLDTKIRTITENLIKSGQYIDTPVAVFKKEDLEEFLAAENSYD